MGCRRSWRSRSRNRTTPPRVSLPQIGGQEGPKHGIEDYLSIKYTCLGWRASRISCLDFLADSTHRVSGNECWPMRTPVAHRVRKHRDQRMAQGERRISAFVDSETLSFMDA